MYLKYKNVCVILLIVVVLFDVKEEIPKDSGAEIFIYGGFYEKEKSVMDVCGPCDRRRVVVCRLRCDDGNAGVWQCGGG
jgi:hypothetical protein